MASGWVHTGCHAHSLSTTNDSSKATQLAKSQERASKSCTQHKIIQLCCSIVFLKSHSISSMFRGTFLDAPFSSPFSIAALSFGESIHCHSAKEGYALDDWLNNPLSQVSQNSLPVKPWHSHKRVSRCRKSSRHVHVQGLISDV